MVLQRGVPVRIWGWAAPGQTVTVRFPGCAGTCTAGTDGKWSVLLPAPDPGGPYELTVTADAAVRIRDILVGDVWVCAGQSNMQLPMARVADRYPADIASCDEPYIRLFDVPMHWNFSSEEEDYASGAWIPANTDTIRRFTAIGYFFAREMAHTRHVPVGLVNTAIGGTPAEAWLDEASLKGFPRAYIAAEPFKNENYIKSVTAHDEKSIAEWTRSLEAADPGGHTGETPWYDPGLDDSGWETLSLPSYWVDEGLDFENGVIWFRKTVDVPESMTGVPARLELGRIVDSDTAYINGAFAGSVAYRYPPRNYDLPAGLLKPGKNVIAVRVVSCRGKGGFIAGKPYRLTVGGQSLDLTGQWQYRVGVSSPPQPEMTFIQYKPTGVFNGMIAPLLNYRIRGVIWYQGESNTHDPTDYARMFKALIQTWRKRWKQGNFPFLFVQLPKYAESEDANAVGKWPLLREAQAAALSLPDTAMAAALDLGEWNDLHPQNKKDVAHRLFLCAQHTAYRDGTVVFSGPTLRSASSDDGKAVLNFSNVGGGLTAGGGGELLGFELAGPDGRFFPARAAIEEDSVVLWSGVVKNPSAARYAWADDPEDANLYNAEGLPAPPFRTSLY